MRPSPASLPWLVLLTVGATLLGGLLVLWLLVGLMFQADLEPVVRNKGRVVGDTLAQRLEEAVALGIPLDQLVDMDALLEAMLADDRQVAAVLIEADGRTLYHWQAAWTGARPGDALAPERKGDPHIEIPLRVDDSRQGRLRLITTDSYLRIALRRLAVDLAMALLAGLLITRAVLALVIIDPATDAPTRAARRLRVGMFLLGATLGTSLPDWPLSGLLLPGGMADAAGALLGLGLGATLLGVVGHWLAPHWGFVGGALLTTAALLGAALDPTPWPWWVAGLVGAGSGLYLGTMVAVTDRESSGHQPPGPALLAGLAAGLLLGQCTAMALGPGIQRLLLAGLGLGAMLLGPGTARPAPTERRLPGWDGRLLLLGLGAALPARAVALGLPLALLLPWLDNQWPLHQQAWLLAAMALVGLLLWRLGLALGRRWGGAVAVAVGGFLAGAALLMPVFAGTVDRVVVAALLAAAGLGLSLGGQWWWCARLARDRDLPVERFRRGSALLGAPGLLFGPALALLGIASIGPLETIAASGVVLILASLGFSVGSLLLAGDAAVAVNTAPLEPDAP